MNHEKAIKFKLIGRVQRVGMRYFISKNASKLNLKGTVKNCKDGSVEGVATGDEAAIEKLLELLRTNSPGTITKLTVTPVKLDETYKSFKVKLF